MWFYSMPCYVRFSTSYSSSGKKEIDFKNLDEDDKKNEMFISFIIQKKEKELSFSKEISFENYGRIVWRNYLPKNLDLIEKVRESIISDTIVIERLLKNNITNYLKLPKIAWEDWRVTRMLLIRAFSFKQFIETLTKSGQTSEIMDTVIK